MILPAALVAAEFGVFTIARVQQSFSLLVIDMFPKPTGLDTTHSFPSINQIDYRAMPDSYHVACYGEAASRGYTFLGAIPASIAMKATNGYEPRWFMILDKQYFMQRICFTVFILTCMLAALAIQARWLGLLTTMDSRRSALARGTIFG
jgi:hypothetical protein